MAAPIKIFKIEPTEIEFVGEIDNYETLEFHRKFFSAGTFTLTISKAILYANELYENRIIWIADNKIGIIKEVTYKDTANEQLKILKGFEVKGMFKQRETIPSDEQSHQSFATTAGETVIKSVVQRNCIDLTNYLGEDLSFPNFTIDPDQARGTAIDFNTRFQKLDTEIEKAGKVSNLGTVVYLDRQTGKFNFEVIVGNDLTKSGPSENPVIFSTALNNLKNQIYIKSFINTSNIAIVGGSGDGVARNIAITPAPATGFELYVSFVDAKDLSTNPELIARGNEALAEMQPVESFDCDIFLGKKRSYIYETDYDLGDVVTVEDKSLNVQVSKRIESVIEVYSGRNNEGGFQLVINFGDKPKGMKGYTDTKIDVTAGGVQ